MPQATLAEALKAGGQVIVPQTLDEALKMGGKAEGSATTTSAPPDSSSAADVRKRRISDVLAGLGFPSASSVSDAIHHPLDTGLAIAKYAGTGQLAKDAASGLIKAPYTLGKAFMDAAPTAYREAEALFSTSPNYKGPPVQMPSEQEQSDAARAAGTFAAAVPVVAGEAALAKGAANGLRYVGASTWADLKGRLIKAPNVNRWMEVSPKDMIHGANPAEQVLSEQLLGATKEATRSNVKTALQDAGQAMDAKLTAATQQGVTIDATNRVLDPLSKATKKIGLKTDKTFQRQLGQVLDDVLDDYPDLAKLTPEQAHTLKVRIGDSIRWNGTALESEVNEVLKEIYSGLNQEIKSGVPGIADDMSRWGNLYQADKALKKGITNDLAGRGTGADAPGSAARIGKGLTKAVVKGTATYGAYRIFKD